VPNFWVGAVRYTSSLLRGLGQFLLIRADHIESALFGSDQARGNPLPTRPAAVVTEHAQANVVLWVANMRKRSIKDPKSHHSWTRLGRKKPLAGHPPWMACAPLDRP
jgi:hypothetical protein